MINNFTNEMMYRDGDIEGTIDLNQYYYRIDRKLSVLL